ncbi:hypothetical protein BV20DRAFT_533038 [Pilatotrama ljubarskyi]|nr:hypothetical protein BV20DRAFT_533038 [Pilatotrama ljubarskyi]
MRRIIAPVLPWRSPVVAEDQDSDLRDGTCGSSERDGDSRFLSMTAVPLSRGGRSRGRQEYTGEQPPRLACRRRVVLEETHVQDGEVVREAQRRGAIHKPRRLRNLHIQSRKQERTRTSGSSISGPPRGSFLRPAIPPGRCSARGKIRASSRCVVCGFQTRAGARA